jgi:hypothetical protein
MPNTYSLIASSTVGAGGASTIDFTSIPQTYTDLILKGSLRSNDSGSRVDLALAFNGSAISYSSRSVRNADGTASSGTGGTTSIEAGRTPGATNTANTFSNFEFYIPNYTGSNNKSVSVDQVYENNGTNIYISLNAGLWSNTSAITSISIAANTGNYIQYSTAYLYGIIKS